MVRGFRFLAVLFFLVVFTPSVFAADSYLVNNGSTETIDEHGVCKDVTNNAGGTIMVPCKAPGEWSSFLSHLPPGVTAPDCAAGGGGSAGCLVPSETHSCTLKTDGSIACWGDDTYGQSSPPAGTNYAQIGLGGVLWLPFGCALKADGSIACWGSDFAGMATPPAGSYIKMSVAFNHSCAIKVDGSIACWGVNDVGQSTPPGGTDYTNIFEFGQASLGVDNSVSCATKTDGSIVCWGSNNGGGLTSPAGTGYIDIVGGFYHGCALNSDKSISCWGSNLHGETDAPAGNDFISIYATSYMFSGHNCALKTDGSIACWGYNLHGEADAPAGNDFTALSLGTGFSCALKTDGSIVCWGDDTDGAATPPVGNDFIDISGSIVSFATSNSCALKTDGSLTCWGNDTNGQSTPPAGNDFGCPVDCPNIGDVCNDGSINAGQSNGAKMYAADVDQSGAILWSTETVDGTADSVTDGKTNQAWIVANTTLSNYPAFELCENLNRHGHTDWYLPAKDELNVLYVNKASIGGFGMIGANYYGGSTEYDASSAWLQSFTDGTQNWAFKTVFTNNVRCVRRN